ncbi:MAG TPA: ABC transporter permease, partial [Candidatus Blautia merdavium]|nr:ABC transporter permease [Candidatus Blautia merdavium]
ICFLISGSAVLALKMLSDAADSREKYRVLRKLGCSQKAVFQALSLQNGILFFLPLLLAGIHSVFGIQVCMNMLSIYQPEGLGTALAVTLGLLAVIYGGYFLLAQAGCRKVIKE